MKHQKKLLFVALLTAYGAAYANPTPVVQPADPTSVVTTVGGTNTLQVNNRQEYNVNEGGSVTYGNDYNENVDITVSHEPAFSKAVTATATDSQKILGGTGSPFVIKDPSNATMNDSVVGNAGNVGVNQAAGLLNQQANDSALAYWQGGAQDVSQSGKGIFPIPIPVPNKPRVAVQASAMHEQLIDGGNGAMNIGQPFPGANTNSASANMTNSVLNNLGNVGVNQAAGMANQQKNDLALAVAVGLDAAVVSSRAGGAQVQTDVGIDLQTNWNPQSEAGNNVALQNTSNMTGSVNSNLGNIGANQAAGIGNQQANSLAAAAAESTLVTAHAGGFQVIDNPSIVTLYPLINNATMTASVRSNVGNIGVNQASGLSNQQVNNLAISTNQ
ncbi:hypothetical protein EHS17_03780 [Rhodobacteraceae bacterium CH30]|nr:hypothetical protein EHS17_03780 [Rhodobacteraceae bacterium CH30]